MPAVVQSRFSQDIAAELPGYVAAAEPDTIVLGPGGTARETLTADGTVQLVTVLRSLPEAPGAVAVRWTRGQGGAAATSGSRIWIGADSLGRVDLDDAAARGHRRPSLHQGVQRG